MNQRFALLDASDLVVGATKTNLPSRGDVLEEAMNGPSSGLDPELVCVVEVAFFHSLRREARPMELDLSVLVRVRLGKDRSMLAENAFGTRLHYESTSVIDAALGGPAGTWVVAK